MLTTAIGGDEEALHDTVAHDGESGEMLFVANRPDGALANERFQQVLGRQVTANRRYELRATTVRFHSFQRRVPQLFEISRDRVRRFDFHFISPGEANGRCPSAMGSDTVSTEQVRPVGELARLLQKPTGGTPELIILPRKNRLSGVDERVDLSGHFFVVFGR